MRKLVVFQNMSIDGYFTDKDGQMLWAKEGNDDELQAFTAENAKGGGTLLFGRVTYDLMAGFWTTQEAKQTMPTVAERMNNGSKIVFSRTMEKATWHNTRLIKGDLVTEVRKLKQEPGEGITILGSGSLVAQLALEDLIDQYRIVLNPVALGAGRTMFDGIKRNLALKLTDSKIFRSGKVLLCYE